MVTKAQEQRYKHNQDAHIPTHYHGYTVISIGYRTVYRSGSEHMTWRCEIALPYNDLSEADVLADACTIWSDDPVHTIVSVNHIGIDASVMSGDYAQSYTIVSLGQTDDGMMAVVESVPVMGSPLWSMSRKDVQQWLDNHAGQHI